MAFYVGQKVVCVDDDTVEADGVTRLVNGRVFTIRRIANQFSRPGWVIHPRYKGQGPFVWLTEISGRALGDNPYNASRFRPVVERKTDISIFERMLNPAKKAAETVGFLATCWAICVGIEFIQFVGGQ